MGVVGLRLRGGRENSIFHGVELLRRFGTPQESVFVLIHQQLPFDLALAVPAGLEVERTCSSGSLGSAGPRYASLKT